MLNSIKDHATPKEAWNGIVQNNQHRIPVAWFWDTFGENQVTHQLAVERQEDFSRHSFLSNNGMKVIGANFQSLATEMKYPSNKGTPELNRGLAWQKHLNVKTLASNKEYGVDWIHGTSQVRRTIPHLVSRNRRNVSVRD